MPAPGHLAAILLVLACFAPGFASPAGEQPTLPSASAAAPPLQSRAELDVWLKNAEHPTPLDALPPLARQRFLDSLGFGSGGVSTFSLGELQLELTPSQASAVLSLFGLENYAAVIDTRLSEGETWPVPARPSRIEREYDALERESREKGLARDKLEARYVSQFHSLFTEPSLRALTLRDLTHVMLAAQLVGRTTLDPDYSSDISAAVQELERRGKATKPDLRAAYDGLLIARRFDEASRVAAQHPDADLPTVPSVNDALPPDTRSPTLWRFDSSGRSLVRTAADLAPAQILVVAGCHFSQDAAEDIGKDPVLGPLFTKHARWLFPPPGSEDLDAAREWNRKFAHAPVGMLHARDEWPLLPEPWVMPTFLFVGDGEVVEQLKGWPRNPASMRQPLIDAARRLGLLPR